MFKKRTRSELWRMERSLSLGVPPAGAPCGRDFAAAQALRSAEPSFYLGTLSDGRGTLGEAERRLRVSVTARPSPVQLPVEVEVIDRNCFFPLTHE